MNLKLKYTLPLGQMALSSALFLSSYLWQTHWPTHCDAYGSDPAFYLALSVNFPAAALRGLWFRAYLGLNSATADYVLDAATLVALGGLFGYALVLNLASWRSSGTVVIFRSSLLRVATDLVLLLVGIYIVSFAVKETYQLRIVLQGYTCWTPLLLSQVFAIMSCVFQFAWSFALILFFGRDLLGAALHKKASVAAASVDR